MLRDDLALQISKLQALWDAGQAAGIAERLFSADAAICGQGMPARACGKSGVETVVSGMVSDAPKIRIELVDCSNLGDAGASSWLHWQVLGPDRTPVATLRSLTVWRLGNGEWRIVGDMFCDGTL